MEEENTLKSNEKMARGKKRTRTASNFSRLFLNRYILFYFEK